jgi:hypothetical protein
MGADAGTITLLDDTKYPQLRILKFTWLATAGGAFEKTLPAIIVGRLLQIQAFPGGTPPTALSDLAIFSDLDSSQADGLVTAAGDGIDIITTSHKKKVLSVPQPLVDGSLRFQITGNVVANATGTIVLFIEEMRRG